MFCRWPTLVEIPTGPNSSSLLPLHPCKLRSPLLDLDAHLISATILSLDGRHVVFGKVIGGMDIVKLMESHGTPDGPTTQPVEIIDCGELKESEKKA